MKYFSMFTGVGGFELGIGDKGECVGVCEWDSHASKLLASKFPHVRNFGDATKVNPGDLPDFDLICGGFPCQAFSIAGRRGGFTDTRGTLFFEVARIIEAKRPKIVFLENVKGLLNHDKGKTFRVIIQTLSDLGYDVQWMVLNSKFFGVPQNRERVFIIGNIRGTSRPEILPFPTTIQLSEQGPTSGQDSWSVLSSYGKGNRGSPVASCLIHPGHSAGNHRGMNAIQVMSHSRRTGDPKRGGTGPLISSEHSFTQDSTPHYLISDMKIRRLTPMECERLQGFPDNWTLGFSDTQRYKMMGNAVTVNVIRAIASRLL